MSLDSNNHLYLVDGSGYIFRAFHALPPLTRKSDNLPVGAISGFCNMLMKLQSDMATTTQNNPTHLAVIFDASGKTFRNEIYPNYKANRKETPEDLIPQFPIIKDAVRAFGIPSIELKGFEADDLIASYAHKAEKQGAKVTIISSDKDLMQMVNENITMLDTMKNKRIGHKQVIEKFGVPPQKVIDVQALAGDTSDNVPGIPGIGIKTAAQLIGEYENLDNLLEKANEIKQKKRRENLITFADQARLSRELVTLKQDVACEVNFEDMRLKTPEPQALIGFLKAMEFNTITERIGKKFDFDIDSFEANESLRADNVENIIPIGKESPLPEMPPIIPENYHCITNLDSLQIWINEAYQEGHIAVDTETNGLDAMQCKLVGISLASKIGKACYIPLSHSAHDGLDFEDNTPKQLNLETVILQLLPLLADKSVIKIFHNAKFDIQVLKRHGINHIHPFDDTMLMSYAVGAGAHRHAMDELAKKYLGHEPISIKNLLGAGKSKITFDYVPIEKATPYAAEDADITLRLWYYLKYDLITNSVMNVYQTTERPLIPVLVDMEAQGIKIDQNILLHLSNDFGQRMNQTETQIYEQAGEKFNIASPKQLGEILFDKLGLEGGKKTKTGSWGTGADVLESLATEHELPALILQWRGLAKLKSTYTDALPNFIHPTTHRVHSSYSLAATTTGRLSSSDPNLQNIPIKSHDGRAIRTAFIAEENHLLVSADYSQIELRILAHMANIPALKQAFAENVDIHALTASEMFGAPLDSMSSGMRRRAKAINFGIIYGISAFGLANQLGISRQAASDYIKLYFTRFPEIKTYMETIKEKAHEQGFVTTLFGRRIHLSEINSKNAMRRAFSERAAINAPIQGTAADIIRRAMIHMPSALRSANLNARMLLQVHDELIFEIPIGQEEALIKTVKHVMTEACQPCLQLTVPLVVEAKAAKNWDEAH